jgi:hypothetical protein
MPRKNWKLATPTAEPATVTVPAQAPDLAHRAGLTDQLDTQGATRRGDATMQPGPATSVQRLNVRAHGDIAGPDPVTEAARELGLPPAWLEPYLEGLALSGLKKTACRLAKVNRSTVMRYRDAHPEFERREELAFKKALVNVLEPEITRRAVEGVRKVRYGRDGKILSVEREYSDQMALRLAERLETGSWRQKQQIEHSGGIGFKTAAERKDALAKARAELGIAAPGPISGRS